VATHSLIVQGAGGHAKVVLDCALAQGYTVECFYDPTSSKTTFYGIPVRKEYQREDFPHAQVVIAIGDNAVRKRMSGVMFHPFGNIIHPSAMLSPHATVGQGNMIFHGVIVQAGAMISSHVILNTRAQIDHDCVVADFVHVGPGCVLTGNIHVGEGSFLGAGSTVIPGKKIGAWSIVGAGSVVIDDVPDNVVVVGNPARVIKNFKV
jgi:sugar O-acyltransferase (sialic acid O-acetyltransferase NeuD family)